MRFKPMDPKLAAKAIEGYTNVLASESRMLEAFYRQFRCLECKRECQKEAVAGHTFDQTGETLVARSCLRCIYCRCLFDPHTGLILERGDPERVLNIPRVAG